MMTTKQLEQQQNFQGEVISGYVLHLIKLTLENIRLAKQKQLKLTKGKI
jgi:hypothetical protein